MSLATTPTPGRFSLADLEAMPDDGRRYELIGGAIVMTAAPLPIHQRVAVRLTPMLQSAVPDGHELFMAPIDLDLPAASASNPTSWSSHQPVWGSSA